MRTEPVPIEPGGEAAFALAPDATSEDHGYLLTVAVVELPHRVPAGIHGHWIPAE